MSCHSRNKNRELSSAKCNYNSLPLASKFVIVTVGVQRTTFWERIKDTRQLFGPALFDHRNLTLVPLTDWVKSTKKVAQANDRDLLLMPEISLRIIA